MWSIFGRGPPEEKTRRAGRDNKTTKTHDYKYVFYLDDGKQGLLNGSGSDPLVHPCCLEIKAWIRAPVYGVVMDAFLKTHARARFWDGFF